MPSLKNLPGIKQLRGVKDKAVIKIVSELEQAQHEKQALIDNLTRYHDSLQGAIDQMRDLITELDESDDLAEINRELMVGNQQYTKHVANILAAEKNIQEAQKKLERYGKLQEAFLKLASRDAALQAALT